MADEHEVFVKIFVVNDSLLSAGYVYWQVEAEHLRGKVANLAKHVCNLSGLGTVVLTKMRFFIAQSEGDREPTARAEREALSTERLQIGQLCSTIESGSYLLAVIDSLPPTQGKH